MGGIVGYLGSSFAEMVVVEGLKRFEHRGHDPAGLADRRRPPARRSLGNAMSVTVQ